MSSSIPTARTNLRAGLAALAAAGQPLEGVAVIRTGQWSTITEHERVLVLNAIEISRDWAALGRRRIRETYVIPVRVEAYLDGDDVAAIETRLWDLATIVEEHVMGDLKLSGAVRRATPEGALDPGEEAGPPADSDDVLLARLTLRIACEAIVDLST